MARIVTGPDGVATFEGEPGQYRADLIPASQYRDVPDVEFSLVDGEDSSDTFRLVKKGGRKSFLVLDAATNQPVGNLEIEVSAVIP